jgi:hypothetical protein
LRGELDGVAEQVDEDLADAQGIAADPGGQVLRERDVQCELLVGGAHGNHGDRFVDDRRDAHGADVDAQLAGFDLREVEDVVHHGEQVLAGGEDALAGLAAAAAAVLAQRDAREAEHRAERRADLVAHVGEEVALHLREPLRFLQGAGLHRFEFMLQREVAQHADEGDAGIVDEFVDREFEGQWGAVLAQTDHFPVAAENLRAARFEIAAQIAVVRRTLRFRHQQADVPAEQFLFCVAEQTAGRLVHGEDGALGVDVHDAVEHGAQDGVRMCLAG